MLTPELAEARCRQQRRQQLEHAEFELHRGCIAAGDLTSSPGILGTFVAGILQEIEPAWRRLPTDPWLREVAVHESGHGVVSEKLAAGSVLELGIEKDGGYCKRIAMPAADTLLIIAAGRLAGSILAGFPASPRGTDRTRARQFAGQIRGGVDATLGAAAALAGHCVKAWRDEVLAVATALGRFRKLSGPDVRLILAQFGRS
jgi:hypothetical protein